ncbi:MAG TPA: DUF6265 family protein [Chryseolinea sp.]|nr:DUF6265 family protein [Chryseolinea sp.]
MKTIRHAIGALLTICCLVAQAQTPSNIEDLGWLVGSWKRTNGKPGQAGNERWVIDPEIGLRGFGVTMKGNDTLFIEKMRIVPGDNNALYFVADVIENPRPVYFRITSIHQNDFTCENAEHDFPKRINYRRKMKQLEVTISGNGKSMDYQFVKVD